MSAAYFSVTKPPSVNSLYANLPGRGRVKTKAYRVWLEEAWIDLVQQHPAPVRGAVVVSYRVPWPTTKRKQDLGNLEKALSDLLVTHQIIEDDSLIYDFRLHYGDTGDGKVIVEVKPWVKP